MKFEKIKNDLQLSEDNLKTFKNIVIMIEDVNYYINDLFYPEISEKNPEFLELSKLAKQLEFKIKNLTR
jgi:hypothetical protein